MSTPTEAPTGPIAVEYRDAGGETVIRKLTVEEALATPPDTRGNPVTMLFDHNLTPRGIRALVRAGVDPNFTHDSEVGLCSALHVHSGDVECVEMLLYLGANPSTVVYPPHVPAEVFDRFKTAVYEAYSDKEASFDSMLKYMSAGEVAKLFEDMEESGCRRMRAPREFSVLRRMDVDGWFVHAAAHVAGVANRLTVVSRWHNVIVREVRLFGLVMLRLYGEHSSIWGRGEFAKRYRVEKSLPYLPSDVRSEIVSFLCDKRRASRFGR